MAARCLRSISCNVVVAVYPLCRGAPCRRKVGNVSPQLKVVVEAASPSVEASGDEAGSRWWRRNSAPHRAARSRPTLLAPQDLDASMQLIARRSSKETGFVGPGGLSRPLRAACIADASFAGRFRCLHVAWSPGARMLDRRAHTPLAVGDAAAICSMSEIYTSAARDVMRGASLARHRPCDRNSHGVSSWRSSGADVEPRPW